MTNVELAQRVGLTAPPCLRRVRALEDAGAIRGYHASLNPELLLGASDPLAVGSWLFIPRRRTTTTGTPTAVTSTGTALMASPLYTPEALAAYMGITVATLENWASAGYGPTPIQLGGLIRYTASDVEAWLAAQIELSHGLGG